MRYTVSAHSTQLLATADLRLFRGVRLVSVALFSDIFFNSRRLRSFTNGDGTDAEASSD
jgi:hypothetical protein